MPTSEESLVHFHVNGARATVTINNPPLNILTVEVRQSLYRVFLELKELDRVRILTLRGAGDRSFSVGSDVREFPLEKGVRGGTEKAEFEHELHDLLESLPQVTIAALSGYTLGGGLELALACDLRVASDDAVLGVPEINLAVFPCAGGTQRLLELVGPAKAKELMFLGHQISAQEAERIGIVNRVFPRSQFFEMVEELILELEQKPYAALRAIKACVNTGLRKGTREGMELEINAFGQLFNTKDLQEGVNAFLEKRRPRFQHC